MARTSPTPITALGTPPSTSDPANFDTRADALFGQLPTTVTEVNALGTVTYNNAVDAYNSATTAAADAASSAANAALASAAAGATVWVSGTTYAIGDRRYSPTNGLTYRRLTVGAGTTDPAADTTNWTPLTVTAPAQIITASSVLAISGQRLALNNTATQAAATNLLAYSDQGNLSPWANTGVDITPDAALSASGAMAAEKLYEQLTNLAHFQVQSVSASANATYTYSRVVKAAGWPTVTFQLDDGSGSNFVRATFNLTTGAVTGVANGGLGSGASGTAEYMGDGRWLCALTGKPSTSGSTVRVANGYNNFATYMGDGSSGVYVDGAQLELGTVATSRIATGASSASRAAGVVAPQRVLLPASPGSDAWVSVIAANGSDANMIDPNGQTINGVAGAMRLDSTTASVNLQFIAGSWRTI